MLDGFAIPMLVRRSTLFQQRYTGPTDHFMMVSDDERPERWIPKALNHFNYGKRVVELEETVAQQNCTIVQLVDAVAQQNCTIVQLTDTVAEHNRTIAELKCNIAQVTDAVTELNRTIAELKCNIVQLTDTVATLKIESDLERLHKASCEVLTGIQDINSCLLLESHPLVISRGLKKPFSDMRDARNSVAHVIRSNDSAEVKRKKLALIYRILGVLPPELTDVLESYFDNSEEIVQTTVDILQNTNCGVALTDAAVVKKMNRLFRNTLRVLRKTSVEDL